MKGNRTSTGRFVVNTVVITVNASQGTKATSARGKDRRLYKELVWMSGSCIGSARGRKRRKKQYKLHKRGKDSDLHMIRLKRKRQKNDSSHSEDVVYLGNIRRLVLAAISTLLTAVASTLWAAIALLVASSTLITSSSSYLDEDISCMLE